MAGPNIMSWCRTLTDYISVVPRPTLTRRSPIDDAGRRGCIKDLDEYYSQLVQAIRGGRAHVHGRLDPDLSMKAVFVAEAKSKSETEKVVVKFAYAYNGGAHELLANASPPQAPKLRYCEYDSDVGMWVVVMDYVEGREDPTGDLLTEPVHVDSLRVAVTMLHEHGLVFGDLRAPNILLVDDRAVLIDFDWCGKAGEARYPGDILLDNISWHSEVRRGGLIDRAHDVYLFRLLTQQEL
ncbi:uncharacterized protein B0H18DRAFT_987416 [Fomitopsis serialis]|uniref:uncharacterized protein n=1 Tax=Fomitopsis serialis TaxID=139415 RepID=UPI002007BF89|nr:uncharacterized protein B0H18DRAFT_987416 [Neoantrodia serialis]KAH9932284.1 hypothetical protein B0H18DRAFT_987416 [Neoantrodia serialis]